MHCHYQKWKNVNLCVYRYDHQLVLMMIVDGAVFEDNNSIVKQHAYVDSSHWGRFNFNCQSKVSDGSTLSRRYFKSH